MRALPMTPRIPMPLRHADTPLDTCDHLGQPTWPAAGTPLGRAGPLATPWSTRAPPRSTKVVKRIRNALVNQGTPPGSTKAVAHTRNALVNQGTPPGSTKVVERARNALVNRNEHGRARRRLGQPGYSMGQPRSSSALATPWSTRATWVNQGDRHAARSGHALVNQGTHLDHARGFARSVGSAAALHLGQPR